jgi:hypothetical protein
MTRSEPMHIFLSNAWSMAGAIKIDMAGVCTVYHFVQDMDSMYHEDVNHTCTTILISIRETEREFVCEYVCISDIYA